MKFGSFLWIWPDIKAVKFTWEIPSHWRKIAKLTLGGCFFNSPVQSVWSRFNFRFTWPLMYLVKVIIQSRKVMHLLKSRHHFNLPVVTDRVVCLSSAFEANRRSKSNIAPIITQLLTPGGSDLPPAETQPEHAHPRSRPDHAEQPGPTSLRLVQAAAWPHRQQHFPSRKLRHWNWRQTLLMLKSIEISSRPMSNRGPTTWSNELCRVYSAICAVHIDLLVDFLSLFYRVSLC